MKKIILASVSGIALMGLAACTDADEANQGIDTAPPPATMDDPAAAPTDPAAPADGGTMAPAPAQ